MIRGPVLTCDPVSEKGIRLVPTTEEHLVLREQWENDPIVIGYDLNNSPYPLTLTELRVAFHAENPPEAVAWSIEYDGKIVGRVGISLVSELLRTAQAWVFVGEAKSRNKGIEATALRAAVRFAFEQMNVAGLHAATCERNTELIQAFEAAGFEQCGTQPHSHFIDGNYLADWLGFLSR